MREPEGTVVNWRVPSWACANCTGVPKAALQQPRLDRGVYCVLSVPGRARGGRALNSEGLICPPPRPHDCYLPLGRRREHGDLNPWLGWAQKDPQRPPSPAPW